MADVALDRRINVMVQVWCYWIARDLTKKLQGTEELHEMIKEKLDTECQEVERHIQNREFEWAFDLDYEGLKKFHRSLCSHSRQICVEGKFEAMKFIPPIFDREIENARGKREEERNAKRKQEGVWSRKKVERAFE